MVCAVCLYVYICVCEQKYEFAPLFDIVASVLVSYRRFVCFVFMHTHHALYPNRYYSYMVWNMMSQDCHVTSIALLLNVSDALYFRFDRMDRCLRCYPNDSIAILIGFAIFAKFVFDLLLLLLSKQAPHWICDIQEYACDWAIFVLLLLGRRIWAHRCAYRVFYSLHMHIAAHTYGTQCTVVLACSSIRATVLSYDNPQIFPFIESKMFVYGVCRMCLCVYLTSLYVYNIFVPNPEAS